MASMSIKLYLHGADEPVGSVGGADSDWAPEPGDFVFESCYEGGRCFKVLARLFARTGKALLVEECATPIKLPPAPTEEERKKELEEVARINRELRASWRRGGFGGSGF